MCMTNTKSQTCFFVPGGFWSKLVLLPCIFCLLSIVANEAIAKTNSKKPNIVVILSDDAGYRDFGFQGSDEMLTPNIDAIAKQGVSYSRAYVTTPFCSPSRAGLLTGRYPQRFGYEFNLTDEKLPGVDSKYIGLDVDERTIADYLKAKGYTTIAIGKWHLGNKIHFHPNHRGFDQFYGILGGGSNYHPHQLRFRKSIMRNNKYVVPKEYLTDDFAREAINYIKAVKSPFFLYLAFNAVHTPMDVRKEDLQRFSHIADFQRQRLAAMTWAMDRAIGNVMNTLKEHHDPSNTLVIFTNDNGGDRIGIGADNSPLRGSKGGLLEGGIRVPFVMSWPGKLPNNTQDNRTVSLLDVVPTALEAANIKIPSDIDGQSLFKTDKSRRLYWNYDVTAAIMDGDWKLIRFPDRLPQLYDLSKDIGEKHDLSSAHPEKVSKLLKQLFSWEGEMQHPRWNTGSYWTREDIMRYDEDYIKAQNAAARERLRSEQ